MIIVGYQGIGKSTLAGRRNGFIDLESSCFFFNKEGFLIRDTDWFIPYCNIAIDLSKQGYDVFTSSHKEVRDYLMNRKNNHIINNQTVIAVVPSVTLKDLWIEKLERRYNQSKLTKDYKALQNAKDRYEDNIMEIASDITNTCFINDIDYDLKDIITKFCKENYIV